MSVPVLTAGKERQAGQGRGGAHCKTTCQETKEEGTLFLAYKPMFHLCETAGLLRLSKLMTGAILIDWSLFVQQKTGTAAASMGQSLAAAKAAENSDDEGHDQADLDWNGIQLRNTDGFKMYMYHTMMGFACAICSSITTKAHGARQTSCKDPASHSNGRHLHICRNFSIPSRLYEYGNCSRLLKVFCRTAMACNKGRWVTSP